MSRVVFWLGLLLAAIVALLVVPALAAAPLCPAPHRSQSVVRLFEQNTPCPSTCATYRRDGRRFVLYQRCGGCQVNHHCALACGGADELDNLEWLTAAENLRRGADCSYCREPFFLCGERR